jgi:hypothetical protein
VALGLLIVVIVVFFPQGIMGWVTRRKAPTIDRQAIDRQATDGAA